MTVRRVGDTIFLEGACAVEDAEALLQELQAGAELIDWSACTYLHAACFQLILAVRLPLLGTPVNPAFVRWVTPILQPKARPTGAIIEHELSCRVEA
jgi:hypothetical protein